MSAKAYVAFEIAGADPVQIALELRDKPGVAHVEVLEGPPDIMIMLEADQRSSAAEYLIEIMKELQDKVEHLNVMPVCENAIETYYRSTGRKKARAKKVKVN